MSLEDRLPCQWRMTLDVLCISASFFSQIFWRRFLLSPDRAAELQQQLDQEQLAELVPVHKDFLVIALGSPDRGALWKDGVGYVVTPTLNM